MQKVLVYGEIQADLMDENFKRLQAIKDYTSLQWTERYYDTGGFELHIPMKYLEVAQKTSYIFRRDTSYTGLVITFEVRDMDIILRGEMLESRLKDIVVNTTTTLKGTAETVCRNLVNQFCINPTDPERKIDKLQLGELKNLGSQVDMQRTGKPVFDVVQEILTEQELSFKLRYSLDDDIIYFEVFQGLDRSQSQNINPWCVISKSFFNVLEQTYQETIDIKNFAYVYGEGEGLARKKVVIDQTNGAKRKELYVDARDIQQAEGMTDAEYNQLLTNRGLQKLAEENKPQVIEVRVDTNKMGTFSLGDKATFVDNQIGIIAEDRIIEVLEVSEPQENSKTITFGTEQMTLTKKIKRSES